MNIGLNLRFGLGAHNQLFVFEDSYAQPVGLSRNPGCDIEEAKWAFLTSNPGMIGLGAGLACTKHIGFSEPFILESPQLGRQRGELRSSEYSIVGS